MKIRKTRKGKGKRSIISIYKFMKGHKYSHSVKSINKEINNIDISGIKRILYKLKAWGLVENKHKYPKNRTTKWKVIKDVDIITFLDT